MSNLEPLSESQKRILYVYSGKADPKNAGLDLVARRQMQALTDSGYRITFVSRGRFNHSGVKNISLPLTPANLGSMLPAKYYYNLQHRFFSSLGALVLQNSKFDAVVGWQGSSNSLFRSATQLNVPSLLNCPGICDEQSPFSRSKQSEVFQWPVPDALYYSREYTLASTLLVASEEARQSFIKSGYVESKVINIQRGADITRFRSYPRKEGPFRAVFFGRVCNRKGIFQTLEAWKKAAVPNSELWIIGAVDRSIEKRLLTQLPSNARLFGHRDDAETLLPQCHVQILPTALEGMAKTLVEGAACGCISLVTKESGFPVLHGKTGFLIDRSNTDSIAVTLTGLAANQRNLTEMHHKSSEFVRQNFTWELFSNRFVNAVEKTIQLNSKR
jgi:glycosyltransferase involved in cell wall biosynthesis